MPTLNSLPEKIQRLNIWKRVQKIKKVF